MQDKVYSGIHKLPSGDAPDTIVDGCLVLEGGAFRGVYTAGVLDAFMEAGLNFQCTVGVSAGAMNGVNYVAGQIGRSARVILNYRHDSRYVGLAALKKNRGIVGFDFALNEVNQIIPFNDQRFYDKKRRFVAVATNCLTGEPAYLDRDTCGDIYSAVQASASMPYISRIVDVEGVPCLDGGCSVKIPYQWAIDQGYQKIVVVRTRNDYFRYRETDNRALAERVYRRYPQLVEMLKTSNARYNQSCEALMRLRKAGRLFMVSPSLVMTLNRMEADVEKLGSFYHLGYRDGKNAIEPLRAYLNA